MKWLFSFWTLSLALLVLVGAASRSQKSLRAPLVEIASSPLAERPPASAFRKMTGRNRSLPDQFTWLRIPVPAEVGQWNSAPMILSGSNELQRNIAGFEEIAGSIRELGICDNRFLSPSCRDANIERAFPVKFAPGAVIYLRIDPSELPAQNEIYFAERTYYNRIVIFVNYFLGFSGGICFFMAALALAFFSVKKEATFLCFALYAVFGFITTPVFRGLWDAYRPFEFLPAGAALYPSVQSLARLVDLLLLRSFFDTKNRNPKLDRWLQVLGVGFVLMSVGSLSSPFRGMIWEAFPISLSLETVSMVLALLYLAAKRRQFAFTFLISWGSGFISYLVYELNQLQLIGNSWLLGFTPALMRPMTVILLNHLMVDRMRTVNAEVAVARAREQKSNVIRTLLRVLSHDLSNTTNIILFGADGAANASDDERRAKNLQRLTHAAEAQADIIRNARASFLRSSGSDLNLRPVSLDQSLRAALLLLMPRFEKKNVRIASHLPPVGANVLAEPTSLASQVFSNLLECALEASPEGAVVFVNSLEPEGAMATVEIRFRSSGSGTEATRALLGREFQVPAPDEFGEDERGHDLLAARDFLAAFGGNVKFDTAAAGQSCLTVQLRRA